MEIFIKTFFYGLTLATFFIKMVGKEDFENFFNGDFFKTNFMRLNFVLVAVGVLLGILTAIKATLDGYTLLSIITLSLLMPLATLNVCWHSYKLIK